jgi:hypothetical protein
MKAHPLLEYHLPVNRSREWAWPGQEDNRRWESIRRRFGSVCKAQAGNQRWENTLRRFASVCWGLEATRHRLPRQRP